MPYKNKKDQSKAARKHYLNNKELIKQRALKFNKEARIRNQKFVEDYKRDRCCIDCGESDPVVLQFDHVHGVKTTEVANMVNKPCSIKRIQSEIEKCEIRCANCHLRRHYNLKNIAE